MQICRRPRAAGFATERTIKPGTAELSLGHRLDDPEQLENATITVEPSVLADASPAGCGRYAIRLVRTGEEVVDELHGLFARAIAHDFCANHEMPGKVRVEGRHV